jgi:hypothetical protein
MDFLIEEHFFMRDLDIYQGTPWEGRAKLRSLSGRIGYVFCDIIESLITPINGSARKADENGVGTNLLQPRSNIAGCIPNRLGSTVILLLRSVDRY